MRQTGAVRCGDSVTVTEILNVPKVDLISREYLTVSRVN